MNDNEVKRWMDAKRAEHGLRMLSYTAHNGTKTGWWTAYNEDCVGVEAETYPELVQKIPSIMDKRTVIERKLDEKKKELADLMDELAKEVEK